MPEQSTLGVFLMTALVILVIPGPAVLYIVTRSLGQGRLTGIVSVLGIALGALVHVVAAALGVSAILVSSALAFGIVKYLGAGYLIYLGLRRLLTKDVAPEAPILVATSLTRVFWQGALVNVLNPKTALFFFAFLPQFVDVAQGRVAFQIALLGLTFVVMGIVSDGMWAVLAGSLGNWLTRRPSFLRAERYVSGSVFIGLGLAAAFSGSGKK